MRKSYGITPLTATLVVFAIIAAAFAALSNPASDILPYSVNADSVIRVLEIQPDEKFSLTAEAVNSWLGNGTVTDGNIIRMSVCEFIGKQENLNDLYSLIYIGGNTSDMLFPNTDGLAYANTGDLRGGYRLSGNDITSIKSDALRNYVSAGNPLVIEQSLTEMDNVTVSERYTAFVVNTASNNTGRLHLNAVVRDRDNVNVTDSGIFEFQWQRSEDDGMSFRNIQGATSPTLLDNNATFEGHYRCRITYVGSMTPDNDYVFYTGLVSWDVTVNFTAGGFTIGRPSMTGVNTQHMQGITLTMNQAGALNIRFDMNNSAGEFIYYTVNIHRIEGGVQLEPPVLSMQPPRAASTNTLNVPTNFVFNGEGLYRLSFTLRRSFNGGFTHNNSFDITASADFTVTGTAELSTVFVLLGTGGENSGMGGSITVSETSFRPIISQLRVDNSSNMYSLLARIIVNHAVFTSDQAAGITLAPKQSAGQPIFPLYEFEGRLRILQLAESDRLQSGNYQTAIDGAIDYDITVQTEQSLDGITLYADSLDEFDNPVREWTYNLLLIGCDTAYANNKVRVDALTAQGMAVLFTSNAVTADLDLLNLLNMNRAHTTAAWQPGSNRGALATGVVGRANYSLTGRSATGITPVNRGKIAEYPYDDIDFGFGGTFTPPFQQLEMNNPEVVVWYCLRGDGFLRNDVTNSYYVYQVGNVTYSGINLAEDSGADESKLFVNTVFAAARPAVWADENAPTISFTDSTGRVYDMRHHLVPSDTDESGLLGGGSHSRIYFKISENADINTVSFSFGSFGSFGSFDTDSDDLEDISLSPEESGISGVWFIRLNDTNGSPIMAALENNNEIILRGAIIGGEPKTISLRKLGLFNLH
jgi:hypothetical protein